jgi:hypothetical protein
MILRGYPSYLHLPTRDRPDAWGTQHLHCPRAIVDVRRSPLSSQRRHTTSFPACYPIRPRCASRPVRSMTPRRRSRSPCNRPRPWCLVRCAPPWRGASTAITSVPSPTCPGRSIACACSCASACGFAAIRSAGAVSSPNGCLPWPFPGPDAPYGSPSALLPSAWLWGQGWCTLGSALESSGEPEHPAPRVPPAATARLSHTQGAGRG